MTEGGKAKEVHDALSLACAWWQVHFRAGRSCLDHIPVSATVVYPNTTKIEAFGNDMQRVLPRDEADRRWDYAGALHRLDTMTLRFFDTSDENGPKDEYYSTSNGTITMVVDSPFHLTGTFLRLSLKPWLGVMPTALTWWRTLRDDVRPDTIIDRIDGGAKHAIDVDVQHAVDTVMDLARRAKNDVHGALAELLIGDEVLVVGPEKDPERAKAKLGGPGGLGEVVGPVLESAARLSDGLRFSIVIPTDRYVRRTIELLDALRGIDHRVASIRSSWLDDRTPYRGCNVAICAPLRSFGGLRYEVQFHTPESRRATDYTHPFYEKRRDPSTPPERKLKLDLLTRFRYHRVPMPPGVEDLDDWLIASEGNLV